MEVTEEEELEAQRSTKAKSGFKGVKVTSSRKYQPQNWCPELGTMRTLGSFETAEEAAVVLIEAKRDGPCWEEPVEYRAKRGTVRLTHSLSPYVCAPQITLRDRPTDVLTLCACLSRPAGIARRRRA